MKILNLGCGSKTSDRDGVVNIDWSVALRLRKHPLRKIFVPLFVRGERRARFDALPDNIMVHDLAKGIPFEDESVDVVYHSHVLEHLDRPIAERFLSEVKRVLRPAGIHRIVVPDFEAVCRQYIEHFKACADDPDEAAAHESYIAATLEQSTRREASGTSQQTPIRRFIENVVLGDARRRGETHQWMYDRVSLKNLLLKLGYREVHVLRYDTSLVPEWNSYGLDVDAEGRQYKSHSLYVEAIK